MANFWPSDYSTWEIDGYIQAIRDKNAPSLSPVDGSNPPFSNDGNDMESRGVKVPDAPTVVEMDVAVVKCAGFPADGPIGPRRIYSTCCCTGRR